MSTTRFVALVLGLAATLALVSVGGDRRSDWLPVAIALAVVALPWQFYLHNTALRRGRWTWSAGLMDVAVITGLAVAAPNQVWIAAISALLATIAVDAVTSGRLASIVTAIAAVLATIFATAAVNLTNSTMYVLALIFGATAIVASVGRLSDEQHLSMRRLGALLDGVPGIVWEADAIDEHLVMVSGRVRDILGYSPLELSQSHMTWGQLIHPDDQHRLIDVNRIDDMKWPHAREFRIRSRTGEWVWLRDVVRAELRPDGSWALRGVATDITVQKMATEHADRFTRLVDQIASPTLILQVDADKTTIQVIRSNRAANEWSNAGPLDGYEVADVPWLDDLDIVGEVVRSISSGVVRHRREQPAPVDRADGAIFDIEVCPLDDQAASLTFRDVTDRVSSREATRREALHDPLTGLPNRAHLMERLRRTLTEANHNQRHEAEPSTIALLVLDLDQFKEVNDTLGHHHGDALLRQVAARLANLRRGADLVVRLGGDEFAVLLTDASPERVEKVANEIVENIAAPLTLQGLQVQSSVSIGVASFPTDATEPEELLQRAEVAMYQAKETRQSWVTYNAETDKFSLRRLTLLGELPRALSQDEIVVYYQPKVDLKTGTVVGVEALVRWIHPELGMIRPDEFIELTEVAGLIDELTRKVVSRSVAQLHEWDSIGIKIGVAVNLSARNFHDAGLADFITEQLDLYSVDPSRLMLEITESQVVDDLDLAVSVLLTLNEHGIRTSIDDFGTGFSSFTHLRRLPVHEIKIDRTFVGQMATKANDAVIVRSIVNLGHDLNLEVVAEGVEDEWTLGNLRELGCDRAQGYYFQRAVPPDEIPSFVRQMAGSSA